MVEQIPTWLAAPLIPTLWAIVIYKCYILPGLVKDREAQADCLKDRAEKSAQNGTEE